MKVVLLGGRFMIQILTDVIYDNKKQLATDIYLPTTTLEKSKILLFWHGGGWFRGDKSDLKDLCIKAANQGFTVFAPNYSLAPTEIFPAAHNDCSNFVQWLSKSDYVKNTDAQITQIGASSGGVMALFLAGKFGFPTVTWSAPVSYSTWMTDHNDVKPSPSPQNDLGLDNLSAINAAFYKYFTLTYAGTADPATLQKLDAQSYDYQNLHQLLMINSTTELSPIKYLLDFVDRLAKANHGIDLKLIAGKRHAMAYANDYIDESLKYLLNTI